MNQDLKKKGWIQMKAILDKEMPVRKKRYLIPVWFSVILLTAGFFTGYYFPESDYVQPATAELQPTEMSFSEPNQPAENTTSHAEKPIPRDIHTVNKTMILKKQYNRENLLPAVPKPDTSEPPHHKEANEKTNPATAGTHDDATYNNAGLTEQISIMNYLRENEKPVSFIPTGKAKKIQNGPVTIADAKAAKKQQLSRQLTLHFGTGLFSPNLFSAGIAYNLLIENNRFTYGGGIGYRFIHSRYKEAMATGVLQDSQSIDGEAVQGWKLNGLHQVYLDVNLRYQMGKSYYVGGGVQFPFTLNFLNKSGYDFAANLDSDPTNDPENMPGFSASQTLSGVRSWDIQPYISVGIRITSDLFLFSSIQAGLFPVNTVPLQNKGNIRLNQITAGFHHTL